MRRSSGRLLETISTLRRLSTRHCGSVTSRQWSMKLATTDDQADGAAGLTDCAADRMVKPGPGCNLVQPVRLSAGRGSRCVPHGATRSVEGGSKPPRLPPCRVGHRQGLAASASRTGSSIAHVSRFRGFWARPLGREGRRAGRR